MFYRYILKPILFRFNPETVHDFFTSFGEWAGRHELVRKFIGFMYDYRGPDISRTVDGITYRTPLVLSAGFDYNARLTCILPSIGFGGVEVGSVTARPCEGNKKPRLIRLVKSKSILVRKGLRNEGVEAIIKRLKATPRVPGFVIGVSIARTNDSQSATTEEGIADYVESYRRLNEEGIGDYYTINISCPNAFGGETFTTPKLLDALLGALRKVPSSKPLYLKLPINLSWEVLSALIAVGIEHRINGVIIGNLQKDYDTLTHRSEAPQNFYGGLSGLPTQARSNELIRLAHQAYGEQITIIGCGGVLSPEDALEKIHSGAILLHLITGVLFFGPGLLKKISKTIAIQKN
jgi:dihydroorotate dehydrogenase subfamily 2